MAEIKASSSTHFDYSLKFSNMAFDNAEDYFTTQYIFARGRESHLLKQQMNKFIKIATA